MGLIRHYQKKGFKASNENITNFKKVDFVKLAQANGCLGFRIENIGQLRQELKKALKSEITVVLEIPVGRREYV